MYYTEVKGKRRRVYQKNGKYFVYERVQKFIKERDVIEEAPHTRGPSKKIIQLENQIQDLQTELNDTIQTCALEYQQALENQNVDNTTIENHSLLINQQRMLAEELARLKETSLTETTKLREIILRGEQELQICSQRNEQLSRHSEDVFVQKHKDQQIVQLTENLNRLRNDFSIETERFNRKIIEKQQELDQNRQEFQEQLASIPTNIVLEYKEKLATLTLAYNRRINVLQQEMLIADCKGTECDINTILREITGQLENIDDERFSDSIIDVNRGLADITKLFKAEKVKFEELENTIINQNEHIQRLQTITAGYMNIVDQQTEQITESAARFDNSIDNAEDLTSINIATDNIESITENYRKQLEECNFQLDEKTKQYNICENSRKSCEQNLLDNRGIFTDYQRLADQSIATNNLYKETVAKLDRCREERRQERLVSEEISPNPIFSQSALTEEIEILRNENGQLIRRIHNYEERINELSTIIRRYESENQRLKNEIESVEDVLQECDTTKRELSHYKDRSQELIDELSAKDADITRLTDLIKCSQQDGRFNDVLERCADNTGELR